MKDPPFFQLNYILTKKMNIKHIMAGAFLLSAPAIFSQTIPVDKNLRTGKLNNGFTYYIRHNETPANRAYLYLVNHVGSVLEDDDQQGLAHFMEHMNFNGTKHYPKNELEDFLQKAGVQFGADLNAHTSYDETVFQLPIPTDEPDLIEKAADIIRDWAQDALLDSVDINEERGVVLEEERLGLGASERMRRQYMPVLLNHSRYAARAPIGLHSILTSFKPDVLRRFHHDWYRPGLQAIIVVGDVNADSIEEIIKQKFSDLKVPRPERERVAYTIPVTDENYFLQITDKEYTQDNIEILIKHKASQVKTVEQYRQLLLKNLFAQMLAGRRFSEISRQQSAAYSNMSMDIEPLLGGADMFAFNVIVKNDAWKNSFVQAWSYVEKLSKYGFTQAELDKAKTVYLQSIEQKLKTAAQTVSDDYVKEYQDAFLNGNAIAGIEWEAQYTKTHINEIGLKDINEVLNNYVKNNGTDIFVMSSEPKKSSLPDSVTLASWMKDVSDSTLKAFIADSVSKQLFARKIKPGKIVKRETVSKLGITEVTLSNGVKVVLKPTDFKTEQIFFRAFAPGGTSLYNDSDYDAAANAAALISHCGLDNLNPVELSNVLTAKTINVQSAINARDEQLNGGAVPADMETAMQLVYLQFTSPRKDDKLFKNTIENAAASLANRYADPMNIFADSVNYVLGNYAYRSSPQTQQRLRNISRDKVYKIYKQRFGDASGFTFVFVGDFKTDSLLPLIEKYLGALPSSYKHAKARDLGIHIPSGQLVKKVYAGNENKAVVRLIFSGDYKYSALNNLSLNALTQILEMMLLRDIREKEAEVYTPSVQMLNNKYPQNRFAIVVTFGCAPENTEHLSQMVKQEMQLLTTNGPSGDDIIKFKAAYKKNIGLYLKDNSFWLTYLCGQYENDDDILQVLNMNNDLEQVSAETLKAAAATFMNTKNTIQFELLPANGTTH